MKPDPIAPRRLGESSGPPKGSQARAGRWVAGVLVLVVARVVASVRLRSRQESSPAVSTGSQESELVDSHLAESNGAPVQAQSKWGTNEVLRRLAAIESMTLDPRERVRFIQELIRSADLTEPGCGAAFWDFAFGRLTPETGLEPVLDTLGRFWAIADRDAAWAFLTDPERTSTNPHDRLGDSQFLALKGLLLEWMRSDVAGALERARSFSQPVRRSGLMVHLYLEWLTTAPNDALTEFPNETFQDGMGGLSTRILLLGIVQQQNPALGLKLFDAIPREAWTGVDDPVEVAQYMGWITNHPQLGATLIERLPEPIARPLVTQLVDAWTQVDPMAALEWLVDQSKFAQTGPDVLGNLFKRLAEVDPTSVVARFERLSSQDQSPWAPVLAAEWANRDPRSAVSWAQARWQQGMGPEALLRGTESWIKTDPVGAAAFIREILPTVTQPAEQLEFAQLWVTAEPSAGLDTLRSLVQTEALEARLKQALPASVPADPLTAANAALKISNPLVRGQTVATVGFQWGARHPEDAMNWAASLPQGGERSMAIREIYRAWTINQFESATTSLNRLEPPLRDQALIGIIHERMNNSASDAASLGLRVTDPQTRAELLDSVFQRWGRSNPADATAWLRKSGLPQALQTQMRARVP